MKEVLVCDANQMFRQFLKEKLTPENINVSFAESQRDAFLKMMSQLPELVIFDYTGDEKILLKFLEQKQSNPNSIKTPVIIVGPKESHEKVAQFAKFNVIKYFTKPIKYDVLVDSISNVLKIPIAMDTTPCVLDVHLNDNIVFVEIAQGLNREKLALLKYRISEIIDKNELTKPKVVVMLTGLELSFVDGSNLELLFDNVIADQRVKNENVKILSFDQFTKELIDGHPEYSGFEIVTSLADVLGSLIDTDMGADSTVEDKITSQILNADTDFDDGAVLMQFEAESVKDENEILRPDWSSANNAAAAQMQGQGAQQMLRVAIVDDDQNACIALNSVFARINAQCDVFNNGTDFLNALQSRRYDALSLDMYMPGLTGLDVLNQLRMRNILLPTVVYSQLTQNEMVMKALSLGARAYVFKNQPPLVVVQKVVEVLKK